jgi:hypothetical protein
MQTIHAAAMQTIPAAWMLLAGWVLSTRSTILMASPPHSNANGFRARAPMPDASKRIARTLLHAQGRGSRRRCAPKSPAGNRDS